MADKVRDEERRLTPLQIKILYHLYRKKKFRGSIVGLSKDMGYPSDGAVNPGLRYLVDNGYAKEEFVGTTRVYRLTSKGKNEIGFITLPDYLLIAIFVVGIANLWVAYEYFVLGIPLNPYSDLIGGAAMVVLAYVLVSAKRGLVRKFLDLREPLTDTETESHAVGEDNSA